MEYKIERLNREKVGDLEKLYEAVYSKTPEKEYFRKKYNTAFTGAEYVGFLAYNSSDEPIAFYGVIPCFIEWQSQQILSAQSADTMTDPDYRQKGLFMELCNKTFDLCRELNIKILFGFPNQNSHAGFIKLGWETIGQMQFFLINVDALPFHLLPKKINLLQTPYEIWRDQVFKKYELSSNAVSNSVIRDGFAGVSRSADFMNYKTYSKKSIIKISEANIWIKERDALLIGDIENATAENFPDIVQELKSLARKLGLTQIHFHCDKETTLFHLFSGITEPVHSFPVIIKDFGSSIPADKLKFTLADIDIF